MKRLLLITALTLLAGGLLIVGIVANGSAKREGSLPKLPPVLLGESAGALIPPEAMQIVLPDNSPSLPAEAMVYKLDPPTVDDSSVRDLAEKLGLSSSVKTSPDGQSKIAREGDVNLIVDVRTGTYSYSTTDKPPESVTALPSLDEAKGVARSFILDRNLMSSAELSRFSEDATVTLRTERWDPSAMKWLEPEDLQLGVGYYGKFDGFTVKGAGAKIVVHVGDNGKIETLNYWWPRVTVFKRYPLKAISQIPSDLEHGKSSGLEVPADTQSLSLSAIELVYWAPPIGEKQDLYQPVFFVKGVAEPSRKPFEVYVPAVKDEYYEKGLPKPKLGE